MQIQSPSSTRPAERVKFVAIEKSDPLELFAKNLGLVHQWYRNQPEAGLGLGHFVILEIMTGDVLKALEMARNGQIWSPTK